MISLYEEQEPFGCRMTIVSVFVIRRFNYALMLTSSLLSLYVPRFFFFVKLKFPFLHYIFWRDTISGFPIPSTIGPLHPPLLLFCVRIFLLSNTSVGGPLFSSHGHLRPFLTHRSQVSNSPVYHNLLWPSVHPFHPQYDPVCRVYL